MKEKKGSGVRQVLANVFEVVFIYFVFMIAAGAIRSFLGADSSDAEYLSVSLANVVLCIVLPLVVKKRLDRSIRESLCFRKVKPLDVVMAFFAVYSIPRLLMHLEGILLSDRMTIKSAEDDERSVIFFLAAVIIGPIAEEIFFRYAIMEQMKEKIPRWIVVILASAFFALLHGYNVQGLTCMFIFFVISSVFYERESNLAYTIILHIFYNLVVYVMDAKMFDPFWEIASRTNNGFIIYRPLGLLLLLILAVISIVYFSFYSKEGDS